MGGGMAPRGKNEVPAGAAADLEHMALRRHAEPRDHAVTTEQVVFAGDVVDMPLVAVDRVHQPAMGGLGELAHWSFST